MYPFYNNAQNSLLPLVPFASRNRRVPTLDNRGIYEICTTGIIENTNADVNTVDYGINPHLWRALPNEFVAVWKVRHPVTTTGTDLPVNVVVPTGNSSSTVSSSNSSSSTTKVPVVDNKSTQATGKDVNVPVGSGTEAQQGYTTEHWIYVNKCAGTFRLMGVTAQAATPAAA